MADLLATVYTVVVVLGAAVGTAGVLWVTPGDDRPYASAATALAVVVFVVALGASLL